MKYFRLLFCLLLILLAISCGNDGFMRDAATKSVKPSDAVSLSADTTFHAAFPELLSPFHIYVVNDTLLVFQERVNESGASHLKAYSTETFQYLGASVRYGRGPGEVTNPHIAILDSGEKYLQMSVNSIGEAYSLDFESSLLTGEPSVVRTFQLPSGVVDWLPLNDAGQFVLRIDQGKIVMQELNPDSEIIHEYGFNDAVSNDRNMTFMSSYFAVNPSTYAVVQIMQFFPQINIYDSGRVMSVAVDPAFRNWEAIINRMMGVDTMQYYAGAAVSTENIFALYKGVTLGELMTGNCDSSVHVFDWSGNFICDIKLDSDISCMTFDAKTGFLYCVEKSGSGIIRYDLSAIL